MKPTRREILVQMGTGLAAITINSIWGPISPAEAKIRGVPVRNFDPDQVRTLEALSETLLPGSSEAGIVHYLDDQLSHGGNLLFVRYMENIPSYLSFYKDALNSIERISQNQYGKSFAAIAPQQRASLVAEMSQKNPEGWNGLPAPLFYFVIRNDAVDVFYGSPKGHEKLGIPYMAHIAPPEEKQ